MCTLLTPTLCGCVVKRRLQAPVLSSQYLSEALYPGKRERNMLGFIWLFYPFTAVKGVDSEATSNDSAPTDNDILFYWKPGNKKKYVFNSL